MKIKVLITTPKGQAEKTEKKLRPFLIGDKKKITNEVFVNKEDTQIIWEIECDIRRALKIQKNVTMFEVMARSLFENKMVKKATEKLKKEDQEELEKMLFDMTKVEIINQASANEIVEHNKTYWQKVKEKFKKVESS